MVSLYLEPESGTFVFQTLRADEPALILALPVVPPVISAIIAISDEEFCFICAGFLNLTEFDKLKLTESSSLSQEVDSRQVISGLTLLMALAYLSQGIGQHFCLLSQPLNNFLKAALSYDAAKVANIQALLMVPWIVKPALGLLSDCVPGPGNGRLNYLLIASILAALGYGLASLAGGNILLVTLSVLLATGGMSLATVIMVALTAEDKERTRSYLGLQSVCYYLANIVALYLGGVLIARNSAIDALRLALILSAVPPALLSVYLCFRYFVRAMPRSPIQTDPPTLAGFWDTLKALLLTRPFLATVFFVVLWNFSPSLGVSLYFFETDKLHFSQEFIGSLGSISSFGFLLGSLLFRLYLTRTIGSGSVYLMVLLSCMVSASFLLLRNETTAMIIELIRGISGAIFTLNIYSLAARVTPARYSAVIMAFFLCLYNLAGEFGIVSGGYIYSHWSNMGLLPLVMVSILTTLLSGVFVPAIFADAECAKN